MHLQPMNNADANFSSFSRILRHTLTWIALTLTFRGTPLDLLHSQQYMLHESCDRVFLHRPDLDGVRFCKDRAELGGDSWRYGPQAPPIAGYHH